MNTLKRPTENRQLKVQTSGILRCYSQRCIRRIRKKMGEEVAKLPPPLVFDDLTVFLSRLPSDKPTLADMPGKPTDAVVPWTLHRTLRRNFSNWPTEEIPVPEPLDTWQMKTARQLTIEMPKHA